MPGEALVNLTGEKKKEIKRWDEETQERRRKYLETVLKHEMQSDHDKIQMGLSK